MIELRTLREDELAAWYRHCIGVFRIGDQGYFERHYVCDPEADCSLIFVAADDGEIVSTVRVFARTVWLNGRALSIGGIGEVSTQPAYRKRGLVTKLLDMAVQAMAARGMAVSILFGERQMYERLGWRFCPLHNTLADADSLPALSCAAAVRPYEPDDLPLLMGLYDLFAGRLNGAVIRSETHWRRWVIPQWRQPTVLLLDGRLQAYACAERAGDNQTLIITEIAATPQAESLLPAFFKTLACAAGCRQVRFLSALVPSLKGSERVNPKLFMARLLVPFDGYMDSDALAAAFGQNAGMFPVDMF